MANEKNTTTDGKRRGNATKARRRRTVEDELRIVEDLVQTLQSKLADGKHGSVSDLIRLLQFRRELSAQAEVKEIEIRWVEPFATEHASST